MSEKTKTSQAAAAAERVVIAPPNMRTVTLPCRGTSPLVMNKFSHKTRMQLEEKRTTKQSSGKLEKRPTRDFDQEYSACQHRMADGSHGVPANSFRAAMIDACRTAGYKMTHAKQTFFVVADGYDAQDGTPLVKILGEPRKIVNYIRVKGRNGKAPDIRVRAIFESWRFDLRVRFDEDAISLQDLTNLVVRAGETCGVGDGRATSPGQTGGMGWGFFEVLTDKEAKQS